jgi:hypothetical protein
MIVPRERHGSSTVFLSRAGSFVRRPTLMDYVGSNPRPLTDIISIYEALPRVVAEKKRGPYRPKKLSRVDTALFIARTAFSGRHPIPR